MFEQSILLPEQNRKKPWTFAASIVVEVSVVSVVLLIPLIYTERLGPGFMQSQRIAPPLPKAPTVAQVDHTVVRRPTRVYNPLAAPRHILPLRVVLANLDNAPLPECSACVVGATAFDGIPGSIAIGEPTIAPPPKPRPAEVRKPVDPPPSGPIKVSQGAQEARIIRRVIPTYPSLAKQARVQGTVRLHGMISTEGRIEQLQVISGHPLLIPAAVEAVKQWLYRPTLLNGIPVEVSAPIEVNFILSN
jgi:protein TonB